MLLYSLERAAYEDHNLLAVSDKFEDIKKEYMNRSDDDYYDFWVTIWDGKKNIDIGFNDETKEWELDEPESYVLSYDGTTSLDLFKQFKKENLD
jgi:hypothetical protein